MPDAKPMTRGELIAWDRMLDDPTVIIPSCCCGQCGKCTLLSILMGIPRVRATLDDREARLRRIWDICQSRSDDVSHAVCKEIADLCASALKGESP